MDPNQENPNQDPSWEYLQPVQPEEPNQVNESDQSKT